MCFVWMRWMFEYVWITCEIISSFIKKMSPHIMSSKWVIMTGDFELTFCSEFVWSGIWMCSFGPSCFQLYLTVTQGLYVNLIICSNTKGRWVVKQVLLHKNDATHNSIYIFHISMLFDVLRHNSFKDACLTPP